MGNCQAIDAATLVIQHPNGKVEKMYWSVSANEIMKLNPGHYVALLITTTICHTPTTTTTSKPDAKSPTKTSNTNNNDNRNSPKGSNSSKKNNISTTNSSSTNKGADSKNSTTTGTGTGTGTATGDARNTVRITRVKLLRPSDTLALGHVYRLISSQEVMKGLVAKKQAKMRKNGIELADSEGLKEAEKLVKRSHQHKTNQQVSRHGHRSRTASAANGATTKSKTWQPSLGSISEATS